MPTNAPTRLPRIIDNAQVSRGDEEEGEDDEEVTAVIFKLWIPAP